MNALPEAIKQVLEECRLSFTPRGELPASDRLKIYKKIEEFCDRENTNYFHYRMAKLELTCAWKVLNILESGDLTDNSARELLELAEGFLRGEVEEKELEERRSYFYTEAEDLMDNGEKYFTAGYVGFACIAAVFAVLCELDFDIVGKPEIEVDYEDWMACFYASMAYCGGATWEKGVGDDLKRREFWEWFLNEAVPSLWVSKK
ncbi:MAG: Imm5 family immunity protein [Cyanobacteriota bacterium]|nr:Imm5 family immunity protein [Cyanobacteriota bacterium]